MSGADENKGWVILTHHQHAAELQNLMHAIILQASHCFTTEAFTKILDDAETES